MEYHSDRFSDHSLLFFRDNRLVALLPANIQNNTLYSHAGLTFGGVLSGYDMSTAVMIDVFNSLVNHCRSQGIKEMVYKAIPYIYHSSSSRRRFIRFILFQSKIVRKKRYKLNL